MMTVSEKKRALQEAHTETQQFVATKRIELMQALQEMNELMATDDYSLSLLQILRTFRGRRAWRFSVKSFQITICCWQHGRNFASLMATAPR